MEKLSNRRATREIIDKYDFGFRKRFGQNFLVDESLPGRIVEAAGVGAEDFVLEIGPGIGTLTQYIAEKAHSVTSIEIDATLLPILAETLAAYPNAEVIHADAMKCDLTQIAREHGVGEDRPMKIVANLPYYITTPILMKLLEDRVPAQSITVMVQREVADRMCAGPGSKEYGALSLAVQYYSHPEIVIEVPPESFMPRPKVDSAVIRLDLYAAAEAGAESVPGQGGGRSDLPDEPEKAGSGPAYITAADGEPVEVPPRAKDEELLFRLIRAAFGQRRKTLVNAVGNAPAPPCTKDEVRAALAQMDLSETIRGEALTLEQFIRLADILAADA